MKSMSFGSLSKNFGGVQQALVLALMLVSIFALFYVEMDITYKISVGALVFGIVFLSTLATTIMRQEKEARRARQA